MPTLKSKKSKQKSGKAPANPPSTNVLVSTLGNVLATHQSDKDDPVRHYIHYSKLSDKQLSGIQKANKSRLKNLPADDSDQKGVKFSKDTYPPRYPSAPTEAKRPPGKHKGKPHSKTRGPGRPPNALVAEEYDDDDDSFDYEDDDDESEDEYAAVTIAVTESDTEQLHDLCALIAREVQGFAVELSKRYSLGYCCHQRRYRLPAIANEL